MRKKRRKKFKLDVLRLFRKKPGNTSPQASETLTARHKYHRKTIIAGILTLVITAVVLLCQYSGTGTTVSYTDTTGTAVSYTDTDEEEITLSGTIKTWDGKIVDNESQISVQFNSGSLFISPSNKIGEFSSWDKKTGKFDFSCASGKVSFTVRSPGYAVAYAGPFTLERDQTKNDIEVVLEKGETASVKIVDADSKQPIANATISGKYDIDELYFPPSVSAEPVTTNTSGTAIFSHVANHTVTLDVDASGYQRTKFEKQKLAESGTIALELKKAHPAKGVVISEKTGKPVANAAIIIVVNSVTMQSFERDYDQTVATTDNGGHFTLDKLTDGVKYIFRAKADGYACGLSGEIQAGQNDILIKLSDPIVITGKIIGPIEKLPKENGKHYISYYSTYTSPFNRVSQGYIEQKAFIKTGKKENTFEITDFWGTSITIGTSSWQKTIRLNEPLPKELIMDLNDPLTADGKAYKKRQLILEFETLAGYQKPSGSVMLEYMDPEYSNFASINKQIDIVDGKASTEIVAPGKISYRLAETVGGWFENQKDIAVDAGTKPLVIKVPTIPAGMIYGEVFDVDGKPVGNVSVSNIVVKDSPLLGKTPFLNVQARETGQNELNTKYKISPLPLDGVYKVWVHSGCTSVSSEPITLTKENIPLEVNLTLPRGVDIPVSIVKPDGGPAANVSCRFFNMKNGFSVTMTADREGKLTLERITPVTDNSYRLEVRSDVGCRTANVKIEEFDKPIIITLEPGAQATGILIDNETGWPIPGVAVSANYYYKSESEYLKAEAKTDDQGKFRFSNMQAGRKYRLEFGDCRGQGEITGGQANEQTYLVTINNGSKLEPKQP